MTAVYEQFWIKTGQKLRQKPVSAKVAETLAETCFCQDGLNLGLNWCWQKLANPGENLPIIHQCNLISISAEA